MDTFELAEINIFIEDSQPFTLKSASDGKIVEEEDQTFFLEVLRKSLSMCPSSATSEYHLYRPIKTERGKFVVEKPKHTNGKGDIAFTIRQLTKVK